MTSVIKLIITTYGNFLGREREFSLGMELGMKIHTSGSDNWNGNSIMRIRKSFPQTSIVLCTMNWRMCYSCSVATPQTRCWIARHRRGDVTCTTDTRRRTAAGLRDSCRRRRSGPVYGRVRTTQSGAVVVTNPTPCLRRSRPSRNALWVLLTSV